MKSGSRDDSSPLRHDDVSVDVTSSTGADGAHEIVERGRTRNMVNKFELAGSKVNVCGSGPRTFANSSHVENMQKVSHTASTYLRPDSQKILGQS